MFDWTRCAALCLTCRFASWPMFARNLAGQQQETANMLATQTHVRSQDLSSAVGTLQMYFSVSKKRVRRQRR